MHNSSSETDLIRAISAAVQIVTRRFRLPRDAQDELTQDVWVRVLSCPSVISSFSARSSLETYLVSVVANLFRSTEQKRLGRWRPSAKARSLGGAALQLERAIDRDGVSPGEAIEQHCHNVSAGPAERREVESLVETLILQRRKPLLGSCMIADDNSARDRAVHVVEACATADRVGKVLHSAVRSLQPTEREILRKLYVVKKTIRAIALELERPEREVYRRVEKLHRHLRELLSRGGIGVADVQVTLRRVGLKSNVLEQSSDPAPNAILASSRPHD